MEDDMKATGPANVADVAGSGMQEVGKQRNFFIVIVLSIVTLGIYQFIWGYCLYEEMRNWRKQGMQGIIFLLLCLVLGLGFIISYFLLPAYVGRLYVEDGQDRPISGYTGLWVFVPLLGIFIWLWQVQKHLNAFWEQKQ